MSIFDFFKTSGTQELLTKQIANRNYLNRQILRYLNNTPVWMEDNPEKYVDDGYMFNPDVYSVINQITKAASAVPPVVQKIVNEKKAREYFRIKHFMRNKSSLSLLKKSIDLKEQAFEEAPESDLAKMLERPNPLQSFPEWLENTLGFKLVTGNSYVHGVELTDKRIGEMWVMPAQYTRIHADSNFEGLISGYSINLFGYEEEIPEELVMHLKYWNPDYDANGSHLYGMSPMKVLRQIIRNSNDAQTAQSKAFKNMGAAGMLFPDDPDIAELTEKQQSQIQKHFKKNAAGPENFKSALVTSVKMGWQSFGMSPVDMAILESMRESRRIICNVYNGFPMILLNDSESTTYNNIQEARKRLYLDIVIPELELLYSELNRWLTKPQENLDGVKVPARFNDAKYFIDYDVSGIEALADDMKSKVEWVTKLYDMGLPPNRAIEEMGFDPVDNPLFDEPWVDFNKVPISQVMNDPTLTEEEKSLALLEYARNGN